MKRLWRNADITQSTKIVLLQILAFRVVLYGLEIGPINMQGQQAIEM